MASSNGATDEAFAKQSTTMADVQPTKLLFHYAAHQETYEHETTISAIWPLPSLPEADRSVFKIPPDIGEDTLLAIATTSTMFHPQGGGQPSDVGELHVTSKDNDQHTFHVLSARTSVTKPAIVLHFAHWSAGHVESADSLIGAEVLQQVDPEKRHLFSRLHTAGHVLGAATRQLLEDKIENFDELKASHFPDSAACEFQGSIEGKWKGEIQSSIDQLVDGDAEVRIGWWKKSDFRERNLDRLLPSDEDWKAIAIAVDESGEEVASSTEAADDADTRIRVVEIMGTEVYPCGGTHVPTTKACGKVTVRKISRQKGNSRVSYAVDQ